MSAIRFLPRFKPERDSNIATHKPRPELPPPLGDDQRDLENNTIFNYILRYNKVDKNICIKTERRTMTELINQMEKLIPVAGFILDITFLYILVHFLCFNYRMGIEYRIICLAGNIMSLLWTSHCPAYRIRALSDESVCHEPRIPDEFFPLLAGAEASAIMTKRILYLLSYIIGVVLIRIAVMAAFTSKHLTDRIRLKRLLDHTLGGIYGVLQVLFFASSLHYIFVMYYQISRL